MPLNPQPGDDFLKAIERDLDHMLNCTTYPTEGDQLLCWGQELRELLSWVRDAQQVARQEKMAP